MQSDWEKVYQLRDDMRTVKKLKPHLASEQKALKEKQESLSENLIEEIKYSSFTVLCFKGYGIFAIIYGLIYAAIYVLSMLWAVLSWITSGSDFWQKLCYYAGLPAIWLPRLLSQLLIQENFMYNSQPSDVGLFDVFEVCSALVSIALLLLVVTVIIGIPVNAVRKPIINEKNKKIREQNKAIEKANSDKISEWMNSYDYISRITNINALKSKLRECNRRIEINKYVFYSYTTYTSDYTFEGRYHHIAEYIATRPDYDAHYEGSDLRAAIKGWENMIDLWLEADNNRAQVMRNRYG